MFCPNCGKQIADDSVFCAECGTSLTPQAAPTPVAPPVAPVTPPVAPVAPPVAPVYGGTQYGAPYQAEQSPIVRDTIAYIKGFFSPKMSETSGLAVRSNGIQWLIFSLVSILLSALSFTLNFLYINNSAQKQYMNIYDYEGKVVSIFKDEYSFGGMFIWYTGLLLLAFFVLAAGLYVMTQFAFKKVVPFTGILNLVAYATLPITIVALANMLLGLIFVPLAEAAFLAAVFMSLYLIYEELKKLAPPQKNGMFAFVIVVAVLFVLIYLLAALTINWTLQEDASNFSYYAALIVDKS